MASHGVGGVPQKAGGRFIAVRGPPHRAAGLSFAKPNVLFRHTFMAAHHSIKLIRILVILVLLVGMILDWKGRRTFFGREPEFEEPVFENMYQEYHYESI